MICCFPATRVELPTGECIDLLVSAVNSLCEISGILRGNEYQVRTWIYRARVAIYLEIIFVIASASSSRTDNSIPGSCDPPYKLSQVVLVLSKSHNSMQNSSSYFCDDGLN